MHLPSVMVEALQNEPAQPAPAENPVVAGGFEEALAEAEGKVTPSESPRLSPANDSSRPFQKPEDRDNEVQYAAVLLVNTQVSQLVQSPALLIDVAQTGVPAPTSESDGSPLSLTSTAALPHQTFETVQAFEAMSPIVPNIPVQKGEPQASGEESQPDVLRPEAAQPGLPVGAAKENRDPSPAEIPHKKLPPDRLEFTTSELVPPSRSIRREIASSSDQPTVPRMTKATQPGPLDGQPRDTERENEGLLLANKHKSLHPTEDAKRSPSILGTNSGSSIEANPLTEQAQLPSPVPVASDASRSAEHLINGPSSPDILLSHAALTTRPPESREAVRLGFDAPSFPDQANPGAAARILASAERQEMQFTYTTPEFGEIEIRTTVKHDQVGAMISVPDPRLRELLHSNLDYLDNALSQQSLQLGTFQATTSDSHSGRERAFDPRYSPIRWNAATDAEHVILPHVETYAHNGALDLRA